MKNNTYKLKFNIGDVVYLITDTEQLQRFVTGINIRQGSIVYLLSHILDESYHYEFEIQSGRDIMKSIN